MVKVREVGNVAVNKAGEGFVEELSSVFFDRIYGISRHSVRYYYHYYFHIGAVMMDFSVRRPRYTRPRRQHFIYRSPLLVKVKKVMKIRKSIVEVVSMAALLV